MPSSYRTLILRTATGIAALAMLALSGCVAYPYGYGGYYGGGYYAPAPAYYAPPVVVGGWGWRGRGWR